jgi:hypothetical protein
MSSDCLRPGQLLLLIAGDEDRSRAPIQRLGAGRVLAGGLHCSFVVSGEGDVVGHGCGNACVRCGCGSELCRWKIKGTVMFIAPIQIEDMIQSKNYFHVFLIYLFKLYALLCIALPSVFLHVGERRGRSMLFETFATLWLWNTRQLDILISGLDRSVKNLTTTTFFISRPPCSLVLHARFSKSPGPKKHLHFRRGDRNRRGSSWLPAGSHSPS